MANDRWGHRGEDGLTLVECVVAIALLVIILLPTTLFVIESQRSLSQEHLQAEANALASQSLAGLQAEASRNDLPNGFQSTTQSVDEVGTRKTTFTIQTSWTTVQQGTNRTICAAGTGAGPSDQIWLVTSSVSWQGMNGAQPVSQTTEISPGSEGGLQVSSGELAVALDSVGTTAYVATSVSASLTGIWTGGGSQPSVPAGEQTTETGSSVNGTTGKFSGCIVFQDIDVAPGWTYTLSFAGNPTIVQAAEFSDANPDGAYKEPVTLQAGVPNVVTVELNLGTPLTIGFTQGPTGSCTTPGLLTVPATTSQIPITVNNSGLTTYTNDDWVSYGATGASAPTDTAQLLYPGYTTTTAIWAGAGQPSSQAAPCTINAAGGAGAPLTIYLRLYDLKMSVSGAPSSLVATGIGGSGIVYSLIVAPASQTDIPLGQYALGDGSGTVTSGGVPAVVWVTEGGNCLSSAAIAPTPCNSPISVVAS